MFTTDALSFLSAFFGGIYRLLNGVIVPGTHVTPFQLSIGLLVTLFVIGLVHTFFGITSGFAARGGNNRAVRSRSAKKDGDV